MDTKKLQEDLEEIWRDDLLDRRSDAEFIIGFLLGRIQERREHGRPATFVLNLDAKWGQGKSFFIERLKATLAAQEYLVASVNAWEDDHADDPMLPVLSAIDKAVAPFIQSKERARRSWRSVKKTTTAVVIAATKGATLQLAKKALGEGAAKISDILENSLVDDTSSAASDDVSSEIKKVLDARAKSLIDGFDEEKRSIAEFKRQLNEFLKIVGEKSRRLPLFVLIDELDRCRPTYAISALERSKHLFNIDNVVFLIATDTDQLQHAIKSVYGAEFDAKRYLLRFFDRTYSFPEPALSSFVRSVSTFNESDKSKIDQIPNVDLEFYLDRAFDYFNLSLRDIQQCMDIFRSTVTAWQYKVPLQSAALIPLIVGHQQGMEPLLSEEFITSLIQRTNTNSSNDKGWRITFPATRGYDREYKQQIVSGVGVFQSLCRFSFDSLDKIAEKGTHSQIEDWRREIAQREFVFLHQNTVRGKPPFSIIARYPRLIRSAGRLVAF